MTINKLNLPAKENAVQSKINEIIDNFPASTTVDQTYDSTSANAQSGVAINGELTSNYQPKLVSGTNIKTINSTSLLGSGNIAVLQNNSDANATGALSILGNYNLYQGAISIGKDAASQGVFSVSLGEDASAGESSIAIGSNAVANTYSAIQIGEGTNSNSETLSVGFRGKEGAYNPVNYQLLDGSTGLIPDARISSNIARTSAIPTKISDLTDDTVTYPIDQTDTVTNQNSGENALKYWTGTKVQYDAIVTKNADTLYNITDDNTASAYQAYTKSEVDTLIANALNDALYYKAGDTYEIDGNNITIGADSICFPAIVTSSGKRVRFTITTPKRLTNISAVTCTELVTYFRSSTGGYVPSANWDAVANADSIDIAIAGENLVLVEVYYSGFTFTNNTPVGGSINKISLTFS